MRLPNGYGSVYKLSGKRRKQWAAVITIGWTNDGKRIRKIIGTAETKPKGLEILLNYHKNPYDIDNFKLTFEEIYNKWYEWKFKSDKLSAKSEMRYSNAFKYYKELYRTPFVDINILMVQNIIDACIHGYSTKSDIKSLFCQLYDYCKGVLDLPVKNIATKYLDIGDYKKSEKHIPFTEEEIDTLWNNLYKIPDVDLILIDIYTGERPSELLDPTELHIDEKYIIAGIKTEAGIDRPIPLHEKILNLAKKRYIDEPFKYTYIQYKYRFDKIMKQLGMKHTPHDCRHTFTTRADNVGMNENCKKRILGHAITDTTNGIYTHKTINDLLNAVNLLK